MRWRAPVTDESGRSTCREVWNREGKVLSAPTTHFSMKNVILKQLALALGLSVALSVVSRAQDEPSSRSVTGQGKAKDASVVINQIDTSAYPKVTIFATVLKEGTPLRGLGAADFKVREDEVEQEPLTVVPKLTPLSAVVALDTSGSMKKRLADAQAAAKSFIDTLSPQDKVQVVSFAREAKLLGGGADRDSAKAAIGQTVARGDTALYDALFASVQSLKDKPGRKAITLLSDGADDDGTGKQLSKHSVDDVLALARVVNVPIYTIGVGTEIDEAVLKKVADQTGAMYLLAPQPAELKKLYEKISEQLSGQYTIYYSSNLPADGSAHRVQLKFGGVTGMKEYTAPASAAAPAVAKAAATPTPSVVARASATPLPAEPALIDKQKKAAAAQGEAIKGGNDYEDAVPLKPGQLYHLSHHQRPGEFDYFVVDVKSGQKIVATVKTTDKGIEINEEDKPVAGGSPAAGIAIHSSKKEELEQKRADGRFAKESARYVVADGAEGKYYILVGDSGYAQSLDATFQVDLLNWSDANSGRDAGASEETAVEIVPGTYLENHLTNVGSLDEYDVFKFKAKGGVSYQIKARPASRDGSGAKLGVTGVWDSEGNNLQDPSYAPNGGAVLTVDKVSVEKDGMIFFKIGAWEAADQEVAYSLALGENTVETPAKPQPMGAE